MKPAPTHCKRGHPFTEANTLIKTRADGRTYRSCRACHRDEMARFRAKTPRVDAYQIWAG